MKFPTGPAIPGWQYWPQQACSSGLLGRRPHSGAHHCNPRGCSVVRKQLADLAHRARKNNYHVSVTAKGNRWFCLVAQGPSVDKKVRANWATILVNRWPTMSVPFPPNAFLTIVAVVKVPSHAICTVGVQPDRSVLSHRLLILKHQISGRMHHTKPQ